MSLIGFDLEGPLSPQDNAYELMKLFPGGGRIFEVISRYDDLLTLEGRHGYEPGDTLALIIPFLVHHGIREEQITVMGQHASLTPGAAELIAKLQSQSWRVFCISTSYHQYAFAVTRRLGIPKENVACTSFPLTKIRQALDRSTSALLEQAEQELVSLNPLTDDVKIKRYLDDFYGRKLPGTGAGRLISQVKPIGGARKVEVLSRFSERMRQPLSNWVVVGDSITDFKMLQAVRQAGGLAIAFNANEYALQYATIGLASVRLDELLVVLEAWQRGGRDAVKKLVSEKEKAGGTVDRGWFQWLEESKDTATALQIHRRIRRLVREEAAELG